MTTTCDRSFGSESEAARYSAGYEAGMNAPPLSWHPWGMWDLLWGLGFRDARRDFYPPHLFPPPPSSNP